MAENDWEDVPKKKASGAGTATADGDWENVSPIAGGTAPSGAAPASSSDDLEEYLKKPPAIAPEEKQKPGMWEGIKTAALEATPGLNLLNYASKGLGKIGEWAQGKSEQKHMEELADVAHGGKPPEYFAYTPAAGYDLAARAARMGAGLTAPENAVIGAGAVVAPEVVGPYLAVQGGRGVYQGIGDIREHGVTPENVEQTLTSGAEAAGGLASLGQIPARGGLMKTVTGRGADLAVRGTPFTDAGRVEAAVKQIMDVKPPGTNEIEYKARVQDAVRDMQDAAKSAGKIKTPRDATKALTQRIGELESPISEHLGELTAPEDMVHPDQYQKTISDEIDKQLNSRAGELSASEREAAKQKVMDWLGERPKTYAELEGNRRRMNEDAKKYYQSDTQGKHAIDVSDATAIAQRAAGDGIRDLLYGDGEKPGALEQAGVKVTDADGNPVSLRDMRKRVGNLIEIRNHFEDAINRAERSGDWSMFGSMKRGPSLAAGGLGALMGLMSGSGLSLAAGVAGGELGKALGDYRGSKNVNLNIQKAFRNLESTAPKNPTPALTVNTQTPPRTPQIPRMEGEQIPLNLAPKEAPLFNIEPTPGRFPEPGTWRGPHSPYMEPIGPQEAPQVPLPPMRGEQLGLNLPPKEAPLFNLPQTAGHVPPLERLGGIQNMGAPVGLEQEGTLGEIGRPHAIERIREAPKVVYRAQDVGATEINPRSHAHATESLEEARKYAKGRGNLPGAKPQEVVAINTEKMTPGKDFTLARGPNGPRWAKFHAGAIPKEAIRVVPEEGER